MPQQLDADADQRRGEKQAQPGAGQTCGERGADDDPGNRTEKQVAQQVEAHVADEQMPDPGQDGQRYRMDDVGCDQALGVRRKGYR